MVDSLTRAQRFAELFGAVYLTFHRRDGARNELSGASRAVLTHLAMAGPLTVGEAAQHLDRAQSVVSEIVTGLERRGLLEREPDPADRRRTLVWLSPAGRDRLLADRQVLGGEQLARTIAKMPDAEADALLTGLERLLHLADPPAARPITTREKEDGYDIDTEL